MNEDKVMQIIINLKKFNSDLMDLNIKYAEEIERLQDMDKILRNENINLKLRINKSIEYIKNNAMYSEEWKKCCDDLYTKDCDELLKILKGEKNENNSTSK